MNLGNIYGFLIISSQELFSHLANTDSEVSDEEADPAYGDPKRKRKRRRRDRKSAGF